MDRFYIKEVCGSDFKVKTYVLVDKTTGVNYLFTKAGYGAGLTALVDENGLPIVTRRMNNEKEIIQIKHR